VVPEVEGLLIAEAVVTHKVRACSTVVNKMVVFQ
jgi:hypothetical protein